MRLNKNILILSYDYSFMADPDKIIGDGLDRMREYAKRVRSLTIIVCSRYNHRLPVYKKITDNFELYGTNTRFRMSILYSLIHLSEKLIKERNITVIQSQDSYQLGIIGYYLAKKYRLKLILCMYGSNPYNKEWLQLKWQNRFWAIISKHILPMANKIIVDGELTRKSLIANLINIKKIIYKPIIPVDIMNFKNKPKITQGKIKILFCGRFIKEKNISMLLNIIKKSCEKYQNISYKIIGSGPLYKQISNFISSNDLLKRVDLLGQLSRYRTMLEFKCADIFVLTSNSEGFARVLMEAAAAGLGIVTTRVSGAEDVVYNEKNGFIVEIGNENEFFKKLSIFIEQPKKLYEFKSKISKDFFSKFNYKFSVDLQIVAWQ